MDRNAPVVTVEEARVLWSGFRGKETGNLKQQKPSGGTSEPAVSTTPSYSIYEQVDTKNLEKISREELQLVLLADGPVTDFVEALSVEMEKILRASNNSEIKERLKVGKQLSGENSAWDYTIFKREFLNKEERRAKFTLEKGIKFEQVRHPLDGLSVDECVKLLDNDAYPAYQLLFGLMRSESWNIEPASWFAAVQLKQFRNEVGHPILQVPFAKVAFLQFFICASSTGAYPLLPPDWASGMQGLVKCHSKWSTRIKDKSINSAAIEKYIAPDFETVKEAAEKAVAAFKKRRENATKQVVELPAENQEKVEKVEKKVEEKIEEKVEEKAEEVEEKAQEKVEKQVEEKDKEQVQEKVEEKTEESSGVNPRGRSEEEKAFLTLGPAARKRAKQKLQKERQKEATKAAGIAP
ncbi:hypothetical protein BJ508DRAFT_303714 [Ascobolus immersus RN42]|uniref:Uncharacterized protein n=1 Tax=Ascobolus immersus RN42 TaxID=1160509 RepID=A0A3N4IFM3_ASCIM|nr:hypothetical protein BJ508DRAFT_303714 [Ascobolus immersus RN42]